MNVIEKYQDLLTKPQLRAEGLSLQTSIQRELIELRVVGNMAPEQPATGFGEFHIYLKPEEVDKLIERLKIAKDALVEKLATNLEIVK
jgi:hypothetical protein